jgi:hypothetical protein
MSDTATPTKTVDLPEPNLQALRDRWAVRLAGQNDEIVEVCAFGTGRVSLMGLHTSRFTANETRELAAALLAAAEASENYKVRL